MMKLRIENNISKKIYGIDKIKKHKELGKIILVFFSLCAITVVLILGYDESIKIDDEKKEYVSVFNDTYAYEFFDLDLLNKGETVDEVSENTVKIKERIEKNG